MLTEEVFKWFTIILTTALARWCYGAVTQIRERYSPYLISDGKHGHHWGRLAQLVRAFLLHRKGRRFESGSDYHLMPEWRNWQTRQIQNLMLDEHMGSSPISGTIISKTNRNKSCFLLSFLYSWQRSLLSEIK